jgi:hypothetical protein
MVAFAVSLLDKATVVPPTGAGEDNVIGYEATWFSCKSKVVGRMMLPGGATVTVKLASGMPVAFALI